MISEAPTPGKTDGINRLTRGDLAGSRLTPAENALTTRTAELLPDLKRRLDLGTIAAISHGLNKNYPLAGALLVGQATNEYTYHNDEATVANSIGLQTAHELVTHGLVSGIIQPSDLPATVNVGLLPSQAAIADMLIHGKLANVDESTLRRLKATSASELVASRLIALGRSSGLLQHMSEVVAVKAGEPEALNGHPASRFGITPRELEAFQLIAHGFSTKGVAEALGIADQTVKNRVSAVLHKMHEKQRVMAVQRGFREGVVHLHRVYLPAEQDPVIGIYEASTTNEE